MLKGSFNRLQASIQTVKGVGPATATKLRGRGIETLEDALFFLPSRYQDRRSVRPIAAVPSGEEAVIRGRVVDFGLRGRNRYKQRLHLKLDDGTAALTASWFHFPPRMADNWTLDDEMILFGRMDKYKGAPTMVHPEIVPLREAEDRIGRFVPVYPEISGLSGPRFRRIAQAILDRERDRLASPLPESILDRVDLLELGQALQRVHFPETEEDSSADGLPRQTLIFTELFLYQAGLALARQTNNTLTSAPVSELPLVRQKLAPGLPFSLTAAQERVLDELEADLTAGRPMNRLLQGDVGSGKTIVAALPLLAAGVQGRQGAIMAPTAILAEQHFNFLAPLADDLGVEAALLTAAASNGERKRILADLKSGRIGLIVGTHALIQNGVDFRDLALAVIDEQHRFGVGQRAALTAKGDRPHLLVMTATPIPRSLSLTMYGDLDISIIDEKPPGRRPIVTRLLPRARLERAWRAIRGAAEKGLQTYYVLPAVDSEEMASAEARYAELTEALPDLKIGLIHGRMDKEAQAEVMREFAAGRIDVLTATTVIEVGLDAPGAGLMIVENADRFGLAQLHQLRGRVGRSGGEAACLLIAKSDVQAKARLKLLEQTEDGFEIAEADLEIRGPGELLGARQAGWPDFRMANLLTHSRLLNQARQAAFELIEADPELDRPEHLQLKELLIGRRLRRIVPARSG